jgi:predicted phage terminase large subunit-like protein
MTRCAQKSDAKSRRKIMETLEVREFDAALRLRFDLFLMRCFLTVNPGAAFVDNWHIDAMVHQVERIRDGEVRRLIVNVCPRSLKSLAFNVAFSAFMLGHDPRKRIFCISYGAELAAEHSAQFKAIVQSDWYQRIFPRMQIKRVVDDEVYTTERGFRRWTSVLGAMTGMGGDIFIIDDPIKPVDALSDVKREAVNQWYSNTLLSRLDNKETGIILVVMQRMHQDDLSGYLLRDAEDYYAHLELPAIAEMPQRVPLGHGRYYNRQVGEALHPAFESLERLQMLRREMGASFFSAHYLQRPVPLGGALLQSEWFRYYTRLPDRESGSYIIQSWDTAAKQGLLNSYSVCTTWLVNGRDYYLLDVFRQRMTYPALRDMAIALAERYRPRHILVEDAMTGSALAQEVGRKFHSAVRLIKPEGDKQVRLYLQQAKFEQGRVWFPKEAPWLRTFLEELLSFPDSRNSDQVDSVSQALAYERSGYTPMNVENFSKLLNAMCMAHGWRFR